MLVVACFYVWNTLTRYPAVDHVDHASLLFEGLFQVVGFALVLLGWRRWIDYNETLKAQLSELATVSVTWGFSVAASNLFTSANTVWCWASTSASPRR